MEISGGIGLRSWVEFEGNKLAFQGFRRVYRLVQARGILCNFTDAHGVSH